jgi:2-acylglycerol O-acyltransferase 2
MLIWIAFFAAAFYCANKQIRTALLVYLAYCFLDPSPRTGQRWFRQGTVEWFRNFSCFGAVAEYFPVTLVKTVDLSPDDSPYLFLYHPHGVISMGMGAALATNGCRFDRAFPGIVRHGVTLNASFLVPFLREWMLALGYVSADRETLARKLLPTAGGGRGESVVLVPGGAVEALHAAPDGFELVGHRRGYVRLALETGAQPVPCLGFGENRAFDSLNFPPQSSAYRWQRGMARVLSFSLPLLAHPLPRRRPIHVVVGGPVKFRKGTTVEEGHRQYMAAVQALYDEHKDKYGYRDIPLEWILSS